LATGSTADGWFRWSENRSTAHGAGQIIYCLTATKDSIAKRKRNRMMSIGETLCIVEKYLSVQLFIDETARVARSGLSGQVVAQLRDAGVGHALTLAYNV
jgi:hypothetical protein